MSRSRACGVACGIARGGGCACEVLRGACELRGTRTAHGGRVADALRVCVCACDDDDADDDDDDDDEDDDDSKLM